MVYYDMVWYGMVRYAMVWYGMVFALYWLYINIYIGYLLIIIINNNIVITSSIDFCSCGYNLQGKKINVTSIME